MLTVTNPVEIDQQEVSSLMKTIRGLSVGSIIKIVLLIVVLVVLVKLLCRVFDKFLERSKIDRSLYGFLRAGCRILLYFIAVTIIARDQPDRTAQCGWLGVVTGASGRTQQSGGGDCDPYHQASACGRLCGRW